MNRFLLNPDERIEIKRTFIEKLRGVDISCFANVTINQLPEKSGCYFWTMQLEDDEFKIYIGRTRSLQNRVKDYARGFQLHSPNDYKMQFFQSFISQKLNNPGLNLYFREVSLEESSKEEAELVRRFRPLINARMSWPLKEKAKVREAYRQYYFNYWDSFLE